MACFSDGDAGGFLVDDRRFGGEGGGQGLHGKVVGRAGVAAGGVVDDGDRVVGEQGVCPSPEVVEGSLSRFRLRV